MKHYDYLIVGAGLYGSMMAYRLGKQGKKCLVIDKRGHLGGNIYCENIDGTHSLQQFSEVVFAKDSRTLLQPLVVHHEYFLDILVKLVMIAEF